MREATGLLLNKKAFLQQDTALVGSHLALCNENERGTSAYWVSTDRAATTSPRGQEASEDVAGGSAQQDRVHRGRLARARNTSAVYVLHLVKQDSPRGCPAQR